MQQIKFPLIYVKSIELVLKTYFYFWVEQLDHLESTLESQILALLILQKKSKLMRIHLRGKANDWENHFVIYKWLAY